MFLDAVSLQTPVLTSEKCQTTHSTGRTASVDGVFLPNNNTYTHRFYLCLGMIFFQADPLGIYSKFKYCSFACSAVRVLHNITVQNIMPNLVYVHLLPTRQVWSLGVKHLRVCFSVWQQEFKMFCLGAVVGGWGRCGSDLFVWFISWVLDRIRI